MKATCQSCERPVHMVRIGDGLVAVEPEIISVIQLRGERSPSRSHARRIHAELCDIYQESARKERIHGDLVAYNRKQKKKKWRGL